MAELDDIHYEDGISPTLVAHSMVGAMLRDDVEQRGSQMTLQQGLSTGASCLG